MPRRRALKSQAAMMLADPTRTYSEIGRQLGISRERVRQIATEVPGIPPRSPRVDVCEACRDEIIEARKAGESYTAIAGQIGTTDDAVQKFCMRIGLNSRALQAARVDDWVALYIGATTGEKMTVEQVSERTGWSYMEVYRQLSRRGVVRPSSERARMRHAREKKIRKVHR